MGLEPTALYHCITHALMQAGVEADEEMRLDASICGNLIRLKVLDSSGAVVMMSPAAATRNWEENSSWLA